MEGRERNNMSVNPDALRRPALRAFLPQVAGYV